MEPLGLIPLPGNEFLKELSKQKIKLPFARQQESLQYFEEQTKADNIQQSFTKQMKK